MAKRKTSKKAAARPVVIQVQAPAKKPPRRKARRKNPAAATIVNPKPKWRKRRRNNPGIIKGAVKTLKSPAVPQVAVGGGAGAIVIAASNKYLGPRVGKNWQMAIEGLIALFGLSTMNRVYNGSGPFFSGFVGGSVIAKMIGGFLPFGDLDELDEFDEFDEFDELDGCGDYGQIEFVGGLSEFDDDGIEDVITMRGERGRGVHVVDELGFLPPMLIPPIPPMLLALLRRHGLGWMLRLGIPHGDIMRVVKIRDPHKRKAAIAHLRAAYDKGKSIAAKRHGARFKRHPAVVYHPRKRRTARRPAVTSQQRPPRPPRRGFRPDAARGFGPRGGRGGRRGGRRGRFNEFNELESALLV